MKAGAGLEWIRDAAIAVPDDVLARYVPPLPAKDVQARGKTLRQLCDEYTQSAVARSVGVTPSQMNRMCSGERLFSANTLARLMGAFGSEFDVEATLREHCAEDIASVAPAGVRNAMKAFESLTPDEQRAFLDLAGAAR